LTSTPWKLYNRTGNHQSIMQHIS